MTTQNRYGITLVAALGLAASALFGTSAHAANTPTRYISLSSTGTVKAVPDAVRLNATVSTVQSSNKDALATATSAANAVRSALLAHGVLAKYIKTTTLTVYPEYTYTQDKGSTLIGYRASQGFDVVIMDAKHAGEVVDAIVAVGTDALQINNVTPFVSHASETTEAARVAAVKNAKAKAATYAKLLGVKLGPVIYMEENGSSTVPGPIYALAKADSGATQVDLGQQDVSVSINIRFYIS